MKQKIGTVLEDEVVRRAKRRAAEEGRPLADLIQDALESYLTARAPEPGKRESALRVFCERPLRIAPDQLRAVLEEDAWGA
jgi:hypothetical protein